MGTELIAEILNKKTYHRKPKFCKESAMQLPNKDLLIIVTTSLSMQDRHWLKNIPSANVGPLSYIKSYNDYSIFLSPVNRTEVIDIIKELRNSSLGWDEISAKIV